MYLYPTCVEWDYSYNPIYTLTGNQRNGLKWHGNKNYKNAMVNMASLKLLYYITVRIAVRSIYF